jgi:hormone-sensitive lipase
MLKQIYELIYASFLNPENEIYFAEETSPMWHKFLEFYEELDPFPKDRKVVKSYSKFCEWVIYVNATMSKGFKNDETANGIMKNFKIGNTAVPVNAIFQTGKTALRFLMNKGKCIDEYMNYIANPDIKLAKRIINFFENKYIVQAYQLNLAKVEMSKVIYVPRTAQKVDLEYIKALYTEDSVERLKEIEKYPSQMECYSRENKHNSSFYENLDKKEDFVKVRLISHVKLPFDFENNVWRKLLLESVEGHPQHIKIMAEELNLEIEDSLNAISKTMKGFKQEEVRAITKVVIHIHGGGFITMSSGSHQVYTRTWANRLNCPIFSIDYGLAPEHKYPSAIDDVWQAYVWIVKYSFIQLGIMPEKIVLVGDSAGGNLVTAITMLAIQTGFRIPDQIILCYPALSMNKNYVFPS